MAGAGGTEACDWAEMLLRMYTRWAERHGLVADVIDGLRHEEAGIRQATLHVKGAFAYGQLRGEAGAHRLVRISPFNSDGRRQTSFAAVDVLPDLAGAENVPLPLAELRRDTFRTGGPGGRYL